MSHMSHLLRLPRPNSREIARRKPRYTRMLRETLQNTPLFEPNGVFIKFLRYTL
jgi:hypothetical protein